MVTKIDSSRTPLHKYSGLSLIVIIVILDFYNLLTLGLMSQQNFRKTALPPRQISEVLPREPFWFSVHLLIRISLP
jgi:hypothetical protein